MSCDDQMRNDERYQSLPERPRVIILANLAKEEVVSALAAFRPWLLERGEIVAEPDITTMSPEVASGLPEADLGIVLGGDGTMLAQARHLVNADVPLLGINFGKLGFLAEFTIEDVQHHWERLIAGGCRVSRRLMIEAMVFPEGAPRWGSEGGDDPMPEPVFRCTAMNDVVITAGPPYRMIDLDLAIEPERSQQSAVRFTGDGVIIATPSGSTAYNLSAGGPIVSPGIDGLVISALAPHSLAFRPIVFQSRCDVWVEMLRSNEGTTLVIDGQHSSRLAEGQQVLVRSHPSRVRLIHNPDHNYWTMLSYKMRWAVQPRRR
ncbi:NAD(+)/NADH kinase [Mucisphaera calidilacus]|uniref:NAD kinase n=1 Tax=Mucisphaera calidilacus TaxID=2527982 RepID=A0A518BY82_9BACT|nr:NAD(+)/NADH kinase [Mucisphaera calidilacus]QDU71914.1 putative inorganic polyphosphate/ATP-NAD kinase [Mucisphaera calidilacus]